MNRLFAASLLVALAVIQLTAPIAAASESAESVLTNDLTGQDDRFQEIVASESEPEGPRERQLKSSKSKSSKSKSSTCDCSSSSKSSKSKSSKSKSSSFDPCYCVCNTCSKGGRRLQQPLYEEHEWSS